MDDNAVGIMPIMMQLMLMVMSNHNVVGLMAQLLVAEVILFSYNFYELLITSYPVFSSTLLCNILIGPESDHWQCLSLTDSLTDSLTHCRLVNLNDVTLACEDANSKLIEVVAVADVDDEDHVGKSLFKLCCQFRG